MSNKIDAAIYAQLQAMRVFVEAGTKLVATSQMVSNILADIEEADILTSRNDLMEGAALLEESLKARTNEPLVDYLLNLTATLAQFPADPYTTMAEAADTEEP